MNLAYQRILVVESEENIQNLIPNSTGPKGPNAFRVIWASSEEEMMLHLIEDAGLGAVVLAENICTADFSIIREIKKLNPYIRIIVVSESWQLNAVRKAMNIGVFDFLFTPIDTGELLSVIVRAIEQSSSRINAAKTRYKLLALQRELEIAGEVQNYILPQVFRENDSFKIQGRMIPTRNIGGDFYDYFTIDDDHIGLVIGDVSGKGIPAALFMAITRSLIKMTALSGVSPEDCLRQVNIALCAENPSLMFATVFYGILHMESSELTYCNAGHNPPYLIKPGSKLTCLPGTGDMALGFDEDTVYHCRKIELDADDLLFLYTDGVTEAVDNGSKMYGQTRLENIFSGLQTHDPEELITTLLADLTSFSSGAPQSDDITMLALALEKCRVADHDGQKEQFLFILQNNIEQLIVLQDNIDLFCKKNDFPFAIRHALEISLEELFTNIVNYAYPEGGEHHIHYNFLQSGSTLRIVIKDDGQPFDPTLVNYDKEETSLEHSKIGGWGLKIAHNFMDNIYYERKEKHNILTLIKEIKE
jgi:sigma-B regulation protein RsbU (phosphoserine phosphatase)